MKILHVITQLADFLGDAGQLIMISKHLQDLGHDVTIVTTDGDYFFSDKEASKRYDPMRKKLVEACKEPIYINGVKIQAVHCMIPSMGMYCPSAQKFAKKIIKDFDVVHIFSWYNHVCMEFAKVANNERIPYCITAWASLNSGARKLKRNRKVLLDRLYTKKLIKNASGLHSIGKSETEEYLKLGAKNENIYSIDNGVVLQNFEIKEETRIFEKIGLTPKEQSYLLYLGRIDEKKGIDLLLNAFVNVLKNHSELILVLAGFGNDSYIKEMKSLVAKLQIENNVKFTGFVTEQEKLQLYESAKIFALTSKDDIHPRAVQDALTMGVPVLITKNCDYPEVDEYDAGIIVESNIHSITEGIENMLFSNEKLENQGKNAKNLIKERYLLSNQITKYEKMYQDILK